MNKVVSVFSSVTRNLIPLFTYHYLIEWNGEEKSRNGMYIYTHMHTRRVGSARAEISSGLMPFNPIFYLNVGPRVAIYIPTTPRAKDRLREIAHGHLKKGEQLANVWPTAC